MKPIHTLRTMMTIAAMVIMMSAGLSAEDTHSKKLQAGITKGGDNHEQLFKAPAYLNKSLDYWLNIIRRRDERMISLAFDAIRNIGPAAGAAVPDLTDVVTAPFSPINIEKDSHQAIASKLYDIAVRTEAIDTLRLIGEAGSTATVPLLRWALARRVVPGLARNSDDDELFIELVMMDTEQRIHV